MMLLTRVITLSPQRPPTRSCRYFTCRQGQHTHTCWMLSGLFEKSAVARAACCQVRPNRLGRVVSLCNAAIAALAAIPVTCQVTHLHKGPPYKWLKNMPEHLDGLACMAITQASLSLAPCTESVRLATPARLSCTQAPSCVVQHPYSTDAHPHQHSPLPTCICSACRVSNAAWLPPCDAPRAAAAARLASCHGRYIHSASSSCMGWCRARGKNSTRFHCWLQEQRSTARHPC